MVDIRKIDEFFKGDKFLENPNPQKQSFRVRFLKGAKLIMPSLAAVLVGFMMLFPSLKNESVVSKLDMTRPKKGELEKLHIEQTEFSITDKNNKVSTLFADQVDETEPGSQLLKIINPKGVIPTGTAGQFINVDSKIGYYNQAKQFLQIEENVKAVYADGTTALTQYADYDFQKAFGSGNKNVYAYGDWGKLWSEGFEYYQPDELLVLTGKSKVMNTENTLWADKQIKYYRLQNRLEADNNVKVLNGSNTLYAEKVIGFMRADGKMAFERIEAYDNVRVVDDKNEMYADRMNAFMKPGKGRDIEKIEAFGNVKIITQNGIAQGDYGIYHPDKSEIELRHNVVLLQNGNVIHGDKAVTNLKTSISRIMSDGKDKKRVSGVIAGATVKGNKHEKK